MKKLLPLFVFCISFLAVSQEIKRENIKGKILVEGSDIQGITIYNSSSSMGTVTNEKGEFTIEMGSKDLIEIRALKYQNLNVRVNKSILESKKIARTLVSYCVLSPLIIYVALFGKDLPKFYYDFKKLVK